MWAGFPDHVSGINPADDHREKKKAPSIVILGLHRESSSLLFEMTARYPTEFIQDILVVDFNPEAHKELKEQGYKCQYGDISSIDTLRSLHLGRSKMIICTIPDKILKGTTNLKMLSYLKQLAPNSCKIVTAESSQSALLLYEEGADYVFIPRIISATYLHEIIKRLSVGGPQLIRKEAQQFLNNRVEIIS